jgi:hypothetical protein
MKLSRMVWILPVFIVLASCGTPSANKGLSSEPTATSPKPTVLHVIRPAVNNFPALDRTVQDATAVQRLYASAYTLPIPTPGGAVNCPSDIGMVYHLEFLRNATLIQKMSLDATGCQLLQIGQTEMRFTDEAFRSLFTKTIGIPSLVPGQSHP